MNAAFFCRPPGAPPSVRHLPFRVGTMSARPEEAGAESSENSTAETGETPPSHALRRLLRLETERLRMRQGLGLGGTEVAAVRSDLMDHVVRRACSEAAEAAGQDAQRDLLPVRGGGARRLRPARALPVLRRRSAVPPLGVAVAHARLVRGAHADDALGRGRHGGPQLPLRARVRGRGARRPALAHGASRRAARERATRALFDRCSSGGSRRRCAASRSAREAFRSQMRAEWARAACAARRRPSA